jgi:hypothetical protein
MDENVRHEKGYVHDDVEARPFFWFSVGFAVFGVFAVLVVWGVYNFLAGHHDRTQSEAATRVAVAETAPPEPRLQDDPVRDMITMRREQTALLSSWGWVDKEQGVVRMPIEKAMSLTLERSMVRAQAEPPGAN